MPTSAYAFFVYLVDTKFGCYFTFRLVFLCAYYESLYVPNSSMYFINLNFLGSHQFEGIVWHLIRRSSLTIFLSSDEGHLSALGFARNCESILVAED